MTRRLAAIMFTDLVGFTASAQSDEPATLARLREHDSILKSAITPFGGRVIKSMGDGFLVEFDSALQATECAVEIQRRLRARNATSALPAIRIRVGVHVGDVEESEGDILGDAVNVASRIVPLAEPGGVCLSAQVADLVRNRLELELVRLAPRPVKGVRAPLEAVRVVLPGAERESPEHRSTLLRLAVLPLANISPDPRDEYFADGLTEELISVLSQIPGLRVIARTSVAQYKGTAKSVVQIGTELGVDSVIEGSVRKSGDQLRITVQLIDAATEEHRWAETYERKLENIFAIQGEVAERTAEALQLKLLRSERDSVSEAGTASVAAYDSYLRGIEAARRLAVGVGRPVPAGRDAIGYFERALREDPRFAAAHSHLANHLLAVGGISRTRKETAPRARRHVTRALKLNPRSSDAHTASGNLATQVDHDWPRAEVEFRRALELNPSSSPAHFWYAVLLTILQRYSEANGQTSALIELDPMWFLARQSQVSIRVYAGEWDSAVRLAEHLVTQFGSHPQNGRAARNLLAWVYAYVGRLPDAERVDRSIRHPADPAYRLRHAVFRGWIGQRRSLERLAARWDQLSRTVYVSPGLLVQAYAVLGRGPEALRRLAADERRGESYLWAAYQTPYLDSIRDDPSFVAALERLRLPTRQSWRRAAVPRAPTA